MKSFRLINANPNQLRGKALLYVPILSKGKVAGYNFLFGGDKSKISASDCNLEGASFRIESGLRNGNGPVIAGGCLSDENLIYSFSADIYKSITSLPEEDFHAWTKTLNEGLLDYMENYHIQQQGDKLEEELIASLKINCLSQSDFDLNQLPTQKELEDEITLFLKIQRQNYVNYANIWQIHRRLDSLEQNPKLISCALSRIVESKIISQDKRNYSIAAQSEK